MTLNLSSKLGKLSVVKLVPRFVRIYTLKAVSAARSFVHSPQVRQLRSQTVSLSRIAYHASVQAIGHTRSIAFPLLRSGFNKAKSFRPQKIASLPVIRNIPGYSLRALSFVTPKAKNMTKSFTAIKAPVISRPRTPLKSDLSKFPYDIEKAVDQFASLPMWLTLPLLFASSFAVGIIVSLLI